eukprot:800026-Heterocapsa_arctica.AAC.1
MDEFARTAPPALSSLKLYVDDFLTGYGRGADGTLALSESEVVAQAVQGTKLLVGLFHTEADLPVSRTKGKVFANRKAAGQK